ncbi:hypothetical protein HS088_TW06G00719 [Tripterygium wilfordii]|uniref:DUF868 family protein n=1 Tax=Tripterygium wilfordii TaxID=458696 RepID=A0A7J7DJR2_TRIWF|nr:uncharacterized protein LOC120000967 [Tripterygium wilfordii]XP_038705084.1 uncharacterized protein LOC120000967 [Tripterygium wilfordii]KAF5746548.1 hypothetical protein HS088_TW06G00719 [Tripterygium wilfordii]
MHESIGIPACFTSSEKQTDDPAAITRSGQSMYMSVYQTKIAGECRLITITWCKNLLLHGLSVSVQGPEGNKHYQCKVELKPWNFWRKQGASQFIVDGRRVEVVWDFRAAKFNGETEPRSGYYVGIVSEEEVVLLLGDMKKDAYRKTGCRPSLIDPILVSRREHVFGKKKFLTRVNLNEKGKVQEISIECNSGICSNKNNNNADGFDPEMEIRLDGKLAIHVKHLHWKFRGKESIHESKTTVEVYWDVHDWLFGSGTRHGLFIFRPTTSSSSASPPSSESTPSPLPAEEDNSNGSSGFCLFLYAWKLD